MGSRDWIRRHRRVGACAFGAVGVGKREGADSGEESEIPPDMDVVKKVCEKGGRKEETRRVSVGGRWASWETIFNFSGGREIWRGG